MQQRRQREGEEAEADAETMKCEGSGGDRSNRDD